MILDQKFQTSFLESILRIYSPTGSEGSLSDYLKDVFSQLGFRNVRKDNAENVFGEIGDGSSTLMLCGHMDTVPGKLKVKLENGKLYGRGAVDAKSSLAAMIMAPFVFASEIPCKVFVIASTGEEGDGRGIKQLLQSGVKGDCNIFGEPGGVKNITVGYRGRISFLIKVKTEEGHAGAPWRYNNAIECCFNFLKDLRDKAEKEIMSNNHFHSISMTPNLIRGGRIGNVTANSCQMYVDVRLPPNCSTKNTIDLINETLVDFNKKQNSKTILNFSDDLVEPYVSNLSSISFRALVRSIIEVLGPPVKLLNKTGTGDMNIFAISTNKDALSYGPGDPSLSHTSKEFINVSEYLTSVNILSHLIKQFSYLHNITHQN